MTGTIGIYQQRRHILLDPLLWIKASTLSGGHADGATVSTWPSVETSLPSAISSGATMPLYKSSPFPNVAYNTSDLNFSNFGPLTVDFQRGLTGYAVCRFRSVQNLHRLFDFQGSQLGVDDLLLLFWPNLTFFDRNRGGTTSLTFPYENQWVVLFFQLSYLRRSAYLNVNGSEATGNWNPRNEPRTYLSTRIAHSNFSVDPPSQLDLAELGMWMCDMPIYRVRQMSTEIMTQYGIV